MSCTDGSGRCVRLSDFLPEPLLDPDDGLVVVVAVPLARDQSATVSRVLRRPQCALCL